MFQTSIKEEIVCQQTNALRLLQQYVDSEDEIEDDKEEGERKKYRTVSSSSSSSSSSEEIADENFISEIKKKLENSITDEEDEDENEDDSRRTTKVRKKREPLRVKGELLLEELPPIQDLEITVEEKECLELGTITSVVDQLVLVEAYSHSATLDIDSVLFLDKGKRALGKIFDVIGQVSTPIYCIRFNSHEDIAIKNISVGDKVFCAPRTEYTSYVILPSIMGKGSDASWKNDHEVPSEKQEFSDDEQERSVKKKSKNLNKDRPMAVPRRRMNPALHYNQQPHFSWHNQIQQPPPNHQHQQPPPNWQNQNYNNFYNQFPPPPQNNQ